MVDELKSNLEPIEENDLNLEQKFKGEGGTGMPEIGGKREKLIIPEQAVERKEGAVEKEHFYSQILSKVKTPSQPSPDKSVETDAIDVSKSQDAEAKITKLVAIAEVKGVVHAVRVARHLEDNYVLDEFHDRLLGEELHKALVQKGLLKEL